MCAVDEEQLFGGLHQADTKTLQLGQQVHEAVAYALACSANAMLRDLYVVSVEPVRGAALMRVFVARDAESATCAEQIDRTLRTAVGYIRGEVARAINRKRVPTLQFVLAPDEHDESTWEVNDE